MPKVFDGLIRRLCSTSLIALIRKHFDASNLEAKGKVQVDEEVPSSNSINLNLALIQFISGQ
jgi:hypothetical protein